MLPFLFLLLIYTLAIGLKKSTHNKEYLTKKNYGPSEREREREIYYVMGPYNCMNTDGRAKIHNTSFPNRYQNTRMRILGEVFKVTWTKSKLKQIYLHNCLLNLLRQNGLKISLDKNILPTNSLPFYSII